MIRWFTLSEQKSREHHWWPVGLQKYWADSNGDVWWISPTGKITNKRAKNRKIAYQSHGHTAMRGNVWEQNFEADFQSADDSIHTNISKILSLTPLGGKSSDLIHIVKLLFRKNRSLRDQCNHYQLDEKAQRSLLLLVLSLLIRSPASRATYNNYPKIMNLPPDDDIGKLNMLRNYRIARDLCEKSPLPNIYYTFIRSQKNNFLFGDGNLDWLTQSLTSHRIHGQALITLTPNLCLYLCTPSVMRPAPNCSSLYAAPWMINHINDIVQAYSKEKIFYYGKAPKLSAPFEANNFFSHKSRKDKLLDTLDEITGRQRRFLNFTI